MSTGRIPETRPPAGAHKAAPLAKPAEGVALAPTPHTDQRVSTGVKRLDQLLGGGLPAGAAVLVYGPPFLGKEVLARRFFLGCMDGGHPSIMVLTNQATSEVRRALTSHEKQYAGHEAAGLVRFVDTYSTSVGAQDGFAHAEYLDGALDLNGISLALNKLQKGIIAQHDHHALILDSVSTLVAYTNPSTTFRFLQMLIGRTRLAGATSMFLMDHGMHTDAEVQMFKHLMSGVIEVREQAGKPQLQVQGLGAPQGQGWVEYRYGETEFEITGSFSAGRIR